MIKAEHCWETSSYPESCWLWCGQPSWMSQVHGWEASLQWCKGGEWYSWISYGNNSLSCICTTLCTVRLLCPGPTSAHDLPFTVVVSVGNSPLHKIKLLLIAKDNKVPHINMWSSYSSLGITDKGAGRTEVCREMRVMEGSRIRDGQNMPQRHSRTWLRVQMNLHPLCCR